DVADDRCRSGGGRRRIPRLHRGGDALEAARGAERWAVARALWERRLHRGDSSGEAQWPRGDGKRAQSEVSGPHPQPPLLVGEGAYAPGVEDMPMDESYITLYHGTTLQSARKILGDGMCKRLHVTADAQLAADYAAFRTAEESAETAERAVVAFRVPKDLFAQWLAYGSAREGRSLRGFRCFVLYQVTWETLQGLPA